MKNLKNKLYHELCIFDRIDQVSMPVRCISYIDLQRRYNLAKTKVAVDLISVCGREPLGEPQCHPRGRSERAEQTPLETRRVRDEGNRDVEWPRQEQRQKWRGGRDTDESERKTGQRTLFEPRGGIRRILWVLSSHIVVLFPII